MVADVVACPEGAEFFAAGGEFADEVVECAVVGVASGFGAQDRDAYVGGGIPVGVEASAGRVEEGEASDVRRSATVCVDVGVEGSCELVCGEEVHAAVAYECRSGGCRVECPLQAGTGGPFCSGSTRSAFERGGVVCGPGEVGEVAAFGVVEL